MLNQAIETPPHGMAPSGLGAITEIGLLDILFFARRRWLVIAAATVAVLALGIVYLMVTEPTYTASAEVLLDTQKVDPFGRGEVFADADLTNSDAESQVQVLQSNGLAGIVVDKLDLSHNHVFMAGAWNPISAVRGAIASLWPSPQGESDPAARRSKAVGVLLKNLVATREGLSYMITVSYSSADPALAAKIANQVAQSYLDEQLKARLAAAAGASAWFNQRLGQLRQQAAAADDALQKFRTDHGIIETGPGKGLLDQQQLAEVTTQLGEASANVAQAKAQLATIDKIKKGGLPDAALSDTLRDAVFVQLRQQYLDAQRSAAELAARYGSKHQAVINLRNQMAEIKKSIASELDRIATSYHSDYLVAVARKTALQNNLNALLARAGTQSQLQAQLRNLESKATSLRTVYDGMLSRYTMSVQQESTPFRSARIISPATKPLVKSAPKTSLVLAASLLLGGILGVGAGLALDLTDRRVRTRRQVANSTALDVIGILPRLPPSSPQLPTVRAVGEGRSFVGDPTFGVVLDQPFSAFTETIRTIRVAADTAALREPVKIVGFVSAVPGEGKTTVAMNVARLAAQAGERVLVSDGDLRRPSLSRSLAAPGAPGLLQALSGGTTPDGVLWSDERTGLQLLPAGVTDKLVNSPRVLGSDAMRHLLQRATSYYDLVVVDLPPLLSVVDARAAAHLFDAFVLVVEGGLTSEETLHEALQAADLRSRVLGAVINKVDLARMRRFDRDAGELDYVSPYYEPIAH
jgi:succinoglycan biosynthesis transport protein ExoP